MDNRLEIEKIILSFLLHEPNLLFDEKYPIKSSDFFNKTHKQIYSALANLYARGFNELTVPNIQIQLQKTETLWRDFQEHNGINRLAQIDNLNYKDYNYDNMYGNLKKFTLFQDLNDNGISTTDLYCFEDDPAKAEKMVENIDSMTYKDIIDHYREKIAKIEDKYENFIEKSGIEAGDGLEELLHSFEETPEMGMPLIGDLLNTATRGARRKKVYINSASSGTGKALLNGSKVMTPHGQVNIEKLKIGEEIFGEDGKIYNVTGVYPQGEKDVYRITFSDDSYVDCCEEHLWNFQTKKTREKNDNKWETKTLSEIMATVPIRNGKQDNIYIPITRPVMFQEKFVLINPYLLGALISDECLTLQDKQILYIRNKKIKEKIEKELLKLGISLTAEEKEKYCFRKNNILINELINLELEGIHTWDKFIPEIYKYNSIENRLKFLQGIFDMCGKLKHHSYVNITLSSKNLVLDIKEMCESLGIICFYQEKKNSGYFIENVFINCGTKYVLKIKINKRVSSLLKNIINEKKITRVKEKAYRTIKSIKKIGRGEMTCIRTSNPSHLFLTNNYIVTHNSRLAAGNVAKLGFPMYYDEDKEQWIETGMKCPILFITTELEHSEVQTMFLSYISGVNEEKILNSKYDSINEKNRVLQAMEIIKNTHNVFIEFMPDPSIDSVAAKIRLYALQKDIEYVFYDYIHVSSSTYKTKKEMRDDIWLMLFVDKLKQLANELDIHISTATQVNSSSYEDREIKNEALIRGSKSIADKADFAMITSSILKEQEKALAKSLAIKLGTREPNQILDIYKNRRGKWRSIRIWRYTDLGTCRSWDCFATDTANNPINMVATEITVQHLVKEGAFPIIDNDTGEIIEENRKTTEINDF